MGLKKEDELMKDNKLSSGIISVSDSNKSPVKSEPVGLVQKKALPVSSGLVGKSPRRNKKTGVRQARRNDNNTFLLTLLDDDYQVGEPDITDFISTHQTAFEQLFLEQESMEIWSEFMNRSGEEQDRFLQEVEEGMIRVAKKASLQQQKQQDKNGNTFTMLDAPSTMQEEAPQEVQDKRSEHPAHTPQDCFKKISSRLQTMLRRRHLPRGAVELHEEELLSWFSEDPASVFISTLHSSFDRLLLHAVCQYLGLSSESFDCEGQRQTRVENSKEFFHPPAMLLSTYLDTLS